MMSPAVPEWSSDSPPRWAGQRVALIGRFADLPRRDVQRLVREHGGVPVDQLDDRVTLVVLGRGAAWKDDRSGESADEVRRAAVERGILVIDEQELWRELSGDAPDVRRLYTPAMLAHMLAVPLHVVRRWHRKRLLVSVRTVSKLPYFDFPQVVAARRLADLVAAGVPSKTIERQLAALARRLANRGARWTDWDIVLDGRQLLVHAGEQLVDAAGQLRLDFDADRPATSTAQALANDHGAAATDEASAEAAPPPLDAGEATVDEILSAAAELEDDERFDEAVALYRTSLVARGPHAELCFALADLLYRTGDVAAARERYYMAIELDEEYVEARANLGCVLAEQGQLELAAAAFEGALAHHPQYADAHYHLARTLDELHRREAASDHWARFLTLAPDSPWAEEARARVEQA